MEQVVAALGKVSRWAKNSYPCAEATGSVHSGRSFFTLPTAEPIG
jgi:hypothetical protein